MQATLLLLLLLLCASLASALKSRTCSPRLLSTALHAAKGPRPLHDKFTVQTATPELLDELNVVAWPTWSTASSSKYKTGVRSPLKVYDCNELSYVYKGEVEITNADTGEVAVVRKGDFVTFPNGFKCYWHVTSTVEKNWYIY